MDLEPVADVWRVPGRLKTDEATITFLVELASRQPSITDVVEDLRPDQQNFANGSIWASGKARADGTPVLLKLGSSAPERFFTASIDAAAHDVVPRVFGSGEFDGVGWLALERCDARLEPRSPEDRAAVINTVARFHDAASSVDVESFDVDESWLRSNLESDSFHVGVSWVRRSLERALVQGLPGNVEAALGRLDADWAFVTKECGLTLIHGDVHFRNVVARVPGGPALLIDAMPKSTVWAWDAADLQITAGRIAEDLRPGPDRPQRPGLIHALAEVRYEFGLSTPTDLERVEELVLGWAAARWWRIAPWWRDDVAWRNEIRRRLDALT